MANGNSVITRRMAAIGACVALIAGGCSADDGDGAATSVPSSRATTGDSRAGTTPQTGSDGDVIAGQPFPSARCEANRAAGTITYLSGFDFAASASIVEVLVAQERGYFEALCLDVEVTPSFSTSNYQPVAGGDAQFASGGSFSELLSYAASNEAELVALAVEGRTPIDVLMVKPGEAATLEVLEGTTIGVKGKLNASIAAMLAGAGLEEGAEFETVLLDGFDPLIHMEIPSIVGVPGYRSNEPGQLERAGVEFDVFDPAEFDVPGSFGVLFSSAEFVNEHPTAAQDFMRASMRGLADAIENPDAATAIAVELINGNGNPNFLSPEGEEFRWRVESELVTGTAELPAGVIDPELLQAEVDAYGEVGMFGDETPDIDGTYIDVLGDVYDDDGAVIWPAG